MRRSEILYAATADGAHVAYQVLGHGSCQLVYIPAWVSHLELNWADPSYAAFLTRLADLGTVAVFDKRGTGLSDRVGAAPDLDSRMEDIHAVMDACNMERAVIVGVSSGAAMSALFAATYPQRVRGLVMYAPRARARRAPDYPWGMGTDDYHRETALLREGWESGEFIRSYAVPVFVPSRADDDEFVDRFTAYAQAASTRGDALAITEMWWDIDYRAILPSVCVPALVTGPETASEEAAYVAERIPGAQLVVLPGDDCLAWAGDNKRVVNAIRRFVDRLGDEEAELHRVLATVLFTDIVDSTSQSAAMGDRRWGLVSQEHDEIVRSHLRRFGGREIKTMGDGFLATFEAPSRAIYCGLSLIEAVRRLGIEIRVGLHTGEVEQTDGDVTGIAVATAARIMASAGPSEVLASQTIRDLVAGSGLSFEKAGESELKGVPGSWSLYRAIRIGTAAPIAAT
jgi:class 3 adenylate cyclase/dienelactone hydrolase